MKPWTGVHRFYDPVADFGKNSLVSVAQWRVKESDSLKCLLDYHCEYLPQQRAAQLRWRRKHQLIFLNDEQVRECGVGLEMSRPCTENPTSSTIILLQVRHEPGFDKPCGFSWAKQVVHVLCYWYFYIIHKFLTRSCTCFSLGCHHILLLNKSKRDHWLNLH